MIAFAITIMRATGDAPSHRIYYDKTRTAGSDDPSDPSVTHRVLTIMLSSEY